MAAKTVSEMTLEEAVAQRDALNEFIAGKVEEQRAALREQLAALDAMTGKPAPVAAPAEKGTRASPKVTHRGPNGEEWRSRGQKPRWLTELIAKGHDEKEFRVTE
jgi:DNA-binding protein H-NS